MSEDIFQWKNGYFAGFFIKINRVKENECVLFGVSFQFVVSDYFRSQPYVFKSETAQLLGNVYAAGIVTAVLLSCPYIDRGAVFPYFLQFVFPASGRSMCDFSHVGGAADTGIKGSDNQFHSFFDFVFFS